MEFLSGLSDDQKALLGCFVAFVACGVVMSVTGALRRGNWQVGEDAVNREQTIRARRLQADSDVTSDRKAA